MKNKILFLLTIAVFFTFSYKIYIYYNNKHKTSKIITYIDNINSKPFKDETLTNDYEGYINIPSLNIKNLIKQDTKDNILNQNVVGIHKLSSTFESETGNIILAGHNNNLVFKKLLNIKNNDYIYIITKNKTYKYKTFKTYKVTLNDYFYFTSPKDSKILTLITCINTNERFIVQAYEYN